MEMYKSVEDEEEIEEDEETEGFFVLEGEKSKYIRWGEGSVTSNVSILLILPH